MALDETITFALDQATVTLAEFAEAVAAFSTMVRGLSKEVGAPDVEWVIDALEAGSAMAVIRSPQPERAAPVVAAYARVGEAAAAGTEIPFESAKAPLRRIMGILERSGEAARFETAEREFIVRAARTAPNAGPALVTHPAGVPKPAPPAAAIGAVVGRIQTLSNRGSLRFTLYDLLYDKAVSCYLAAGQQEKLADKWGKLATVEGMVARDPVSGRPLAVRRISAIAELPEGPGGSYIDSGGCSPPLTDLSPEAAIRKLRDA